MSLVHLVSGGLGMAVSFLLLVSLRLGPRSWVLPLHFAPLALCSVALGTADLLRDWTVEASGRAAFALLVLSLPGVLAFSLVFCNEDARATLRRAWPGLLAAVVSAPALVVSQFVSSTSAPPGLDLPVGYLGLSGTLSGAYLLVVVVWTLANLERTLRSVNAPLRWSIKYVVLGLAAICAVTIYIASRVLLHAVVPVEELQILSAALLPAYLLVLVSWRRGSYKHGSVISQSFAYSSITFVSVGVYLLVSSFVANWTGALLPTAHADLLVFLGFAIVLASFMLSTSARHRVRNWLRQNLFFGRYDYRSIWREASERIRDSDPPAQAASALAAIVRHTLGAIEVTVWERVRGTGTIRLLAATGFKTGALSDGQIEEVPAELDDLDDPVEAGSLPVSASGLTRHFVSVTRAVLLVPLRSGSETVGLLTVGSDRTGRDFGWEAQQFLRVLAGHAAGEFHKRTLLAEKVQAKEDEAFRSFSTFLLHDLKNYASTLSMVVENATRHADNPEFRRDAFQSVLDTSEKMKRLCNSLHTFSGSLAADRKPADLNAVVRDVVKHLEKDSSRVELNLADLPAVLIDGEEMARVLQNLLLNAYEALNDRGGIRVETRVVGDEVELRVEDDGEGIPPQFLENSLFLPFHTTKSSGLGIGLFHTKKIIDVHGGTIAIESEEGAGTTVRIRIPSLPSASEAGAAED